VEYQGHMQTVKVTGPDFRIYYHGEAGTERLLAGLQKKYRRRTIIKFPGKATFHWQNPPKQNPP